MKADDLVNLFFVTESTQMGAWCLKRSVASEIIKNWFDAREKVRKKESDWETSKRWLESGTFAYNEYLEDGTVVSSWAVAWNYVIAVYTNPIKTEAQLLQERQVKAQEKLAASVEKQVREGDDWKRGSDDDAA